MRVLEATISGIDTNGFVWENVFHVTSDNDAASEHDILANLGAYINTNLIPVYQAAMALTNKILAVGVRVISPTPSYTLTKNINVSGGRDIPSANGSMAGRIKFLPETGTATGRVYIAGLAVDDVEGDLLTPDYQSLLEDIADIFTGMDGTPVTDHWQLVIWNKKLRTFVKVIADFIYAVVGVLSKRLKA